MSDEKSTETATREKSGRHLANSTALGFLLTGIALGLCVIAVLHMASTYADVSHRGGIDLPEMVVINFDLTIQVWCIACVAFILQLVAAGSFFSGTYGSSRPLLFGFVVWWLFAWLAIGTIVLSRISF